MTVTSALQTKFLDATIEDWAKKYQHDWINSYEKTHQVLVDGSLVDWESIAQDILKDGKLKSDWRYDYKGFHKISAFKWKKLEPTDQREATGAFSIEVISRQLGVFGQGRHSYMRLINDKGEVYSVGFCGKVGFPLAWQRGTLISPDPKEVYTKGERVTSIQVDQKQYSAIFARIQEDKEAGKEAFHLINRNCAAYTSQLLSEHLGIEINNREFVSDAAQRNLLSLIGLKKIPNFLRVIITIVSCTLRFLLLPLAALLYVAIGGPFVHCGKEHKKAYEATFRETARTETVWQRFVKSLKSIFTLNFLKPFTGWRISLWQDRLCNEYGPGPFTVDQAKNVRLSNFFQDARYQGMALQSSKA